MNSSTKWAAIAIGEAALVVTAIATMDWFTAASAVFCGAICWHEWKQRRTARR